MDVRFPASFRRSLLAHDGQDRSDEVFPWMPGCDALAPLEAIVIRWSEEQTLIEEGDAEPYDARAMNVLYHPRRIPIAGSSYWDGDNTYLDLFPARRGKRGQVLTFTSEVDMEVIAESFGAALSAYVAALESGAWMFDQGDGVLRARKHVGDPGHPAEEFAKWVRRQKKGRKTDTT